MKYNIIFNKKNYRYGLEVDIKFIMLEVMVLKFNSIKGMKIYIYIILYIKWMS